MTVLLMIIGGAVGGFLGWLRDRKRMGNQPEAQNQTQQCETST